MTKREKFQKEIRETQLLERLDKSREMIADMCSQRRPPKMRIPAQPIDEDIFIITTLMDAKAELEKHQWIPVSEQVPEGRPIVLMYLENKQYVVDHFVRNWGVDQVAVTHWQPLPEPPQEQS